jgi:hypothetical protein
MSMSAASASDSPRNSFTDPTAHPAASGFARFAFFIVMFLLRSHHSVIISKSTSAGLNDRLRSLLSLLLKHIENDDGISISSVYDAKRAALISDPQLMASCANDRHGS